MMSYEANVRAILECCFSQSKDEIIESAVKCIMALKQEPVVISPIDPTPLKPCPMPYYTTHNTPTIEPIITCENLNNKEN